MSARLFAVLAFVVLAAACGRKDTGQPLYQSVAVERRDIDVKVEASGVIQPVNTVELKSKASGEILKLGADVGDKVQQGALLVSIDPRTPRNRVAQADAQLAATKSRLRTAQAQLARGDKLLDSKWINQADYDKLALDVANAKSEVIAAQVALENARIALDDTELRAPITGTIISRKVSEGQVISSPISDFGGGTLLLTMADLARVQVRAQVDETDIGKIRPGMPVQVTVAAYPGRPFSGEVEKIEPQAIVDQNVTMFNVLVSIENRDGLLMPGMNSDVQLAVAHAGSVLTIPVTALRVDRDVATTAPVLGITEEELREQLKPKQPATAAGAPAATASPQTMTLPSGRTIELPAGVDAAQVRAAMDKRRAGQELNEQERQLLRSVFRGMGGGGMTGGPGGGMAGTTVRLSGEYWVVVDRNGKYTVAPVRTGLTDLDRVEVLSGLTEKDKVLLLPSSSLVEVQEQLQKFVSGRFGGLPGMQRRQEN